jgi:hypothetical protein
MKQALDLLNQIIEMAQQQDEDLKELNILKHRANRTVGEGIVVFHLKALKELLEKEIQSNKFGDSVTFGKNTFQVSLGNLLSCGCRDKAYCNNCRIVWFSTLCLCGGGNCKKCGAPIGFAPPDEGTSEWTRVNYDNGGID